MVDLPDPWRPMTPTTNMSVWSLRYCKTPKQNKSSLQEVTSHIQTSLFFQHNFPANDQMHLTISHLHGTVTPIHLIIHKLDAVLHLLRWEEFGLTNHGWKSNDKIVIKYISTVTARKSWCWLPCWEEGFCVWSFHVLLVSPSFLLRSKNVCVQVDWRLSLTRKCEWIVCLCDELETYVYSALIPQYMSNTVQHCYGTNSDQHKKNTFLRKSAVTHDQQHCLMQKHSFLCFGSGTQAGWVAAPPSPLWRIQQRRAELPSLEQSLASLHRPWLSLAWWASPGLELHCHVYSVMTWPWKRPATA